MLHRTTGLTVVVLVLLLPLALALTACAPDREPTAACNRQSSADGFITLQPEFSHFNLKLPEHFRYDLTLDCKRMRSAMTEMIWFDGKLLAQQDSIKIQDERRKTTVRIILGGFNDPTKKVVSDAGYLDPSRYTVSIPHRDYPLVLYPNSQIFPEDSYPNKRVPRSHFWGIKNTVNPLTGRPFLAHCTIREERKAGQEYIDEDFYGESKCWSTVEAVKGNHQISAAVEVWADGGHELDKIHNAVQSLLESAIEGQ